VAAECGGPALKVVIALPMGCEVRTYAWIARIAFLGVAAILLVGAVQVRREHQSGGDVRLPRFERVAGVMSTDGRVEFWLGADGLPRRLGLHVKMTCADRDRTMNWTWVNRPGARLRREGAWFELRHAGPRRYPDGWRGTSHLSMRLRVPHAKLLVGTLNGQFHYGTRDGRRVDCFWAGAFAAGRCSRHDLERVLQRASTAACRRGSDPGQRARFD
jgi:hypothetical protein